MLFVFCNKESCVYTLACDFLPVAVLAMFTRDISDTEF